MKKRKVKKKVVKKIKREEERPLATLWSKLPSRETYRVQELFNEFRRLDQRAKCTLMGMIKIDEINRDVS